MNDTTANLLLGSMEAMVQHCRRLTRDEDERYSETLNRIIYVAGIELGHLRGAPGPICDSLLGNRTLPEFAAATLR